MPIQQTIIVNSTEYGFDHINELVEIDQNTDRVSALDLKAAIKEAEASETGIVFEKIAEMSNPVTLDAANAVATAQNVVMLRAYCIKPLKSGGSFTLTGGNVVGITRAADIYDINVNTVGISLLSAFATVVEVPKIGDVTLANIRSEIDEALEDVTSSVELIKKYHDNITRFLAADGATEVPQSRAFFFQILDDDGVTELKRISFRTSSDQPTTINSATRYVRV